MDSSVLASKSKSMQTCHNEKMEKTLYSWICKKQKIGVPLSGPMIKEKAFSKTGGSEETFLAIQAMERTLLKNKMEENSKQTKITDAFSVKQFILK